MDPRLLFGKAQRDMDARQLLDKAKKGIEAAELPRREDWADVVRGLCRLKPGERRPEQEGGLRRFEGQAWFQRGGFDWPALSAGSLQAPYIPVPTGPRGRPSSGAGRWSLRGAASRGTGPYVDS